MEKPSDQENNLPEPPEEGEWGYDRQTYRFGRFVSWLPFVGLAVGFLTALYFTTQGTPGSSGVLFNCLVYPVSLIALYLLGWLLLRHRLPLSPRWFAGWMRLVTLLLSAAFLVLLALIFFR